MGSCNIVGKVTGATPLDKFIALGSNLKVCMLSLPTLYLSTTPANCYILTDLQITVLHRNLLFSNTLIS